jgi:hypothetical protein
MKHPLRLLGATLLVGAMGATAFAQVGTAPNLAPNRPAGEGRYDQHHPYAEHFGDYLDHHPGVEGELNHDPALVHDKAYLKAHPDLHEYLDKHPGVAEEFRAHPSNFLRRVHRSQGTDERH